MSPQSNRTWSASTSKKHATSMSCKLESAIWSHDTGQQIPCFDRCQLIITWMSNIKEVHGKPRCMSLSTYYLEYGCHVVRLRRRRCCRHRRCVRMRPRVILLAMITTRKSTHGFPFLSYMSVGLRLAGPLGRQSSAIMSFTDEEH